MGRRSKNKVQWLKAPVLCDKLSFLEACTKMRWKQVLDVTVSGDRSGDLDIEARLSSYCVHNGRNKSGHYSFGWYC